MKSYTGWAVLVAAALTLPVAAQATLLQRGGDGTVAAGVSSPAGGEGWQAYQKINIPTGQNLAFTYQCPDSAPVAVNGGFYANTQARAGLSLVSNFRVGKDASKWEWIIYWPSGAPANAQISFNVYCHSS